LRLKIVEKMKFVKMNLLLLGAAVLFFSQCKKEDQAEVDRQLILEHLATNNITAEEHPSGIFYVITTEGTGTNPGPGAQVTVKYRGYLLNGNTFDQTTGSQTATFSLSDLIPGWQISIPLLKKGGKGTFWIPSELGYGGISLPDIPANSVLVFDIELVNF
jgi:FKBP-type peptidyl-prolyl cis-trans isomerase